MKNLKNELYKIVDIGLYLMSAEIDETFNTEGFGLLSKEQEVYYIKNLCNIHANLFKVLIDETLTNT